MKARIIGSREELGVVSEDGLDFRGHPIHREWTDLVDPDKETLRKLRGNRHFELDEGSTTGPTRKPAPAPAAADPKPVAEPQEVGPTSEDEAALRAELLEYGVTAKDGASLKVLKMQLGKARKAHAAAQD